MRQNRHSFNGVDPLKEGGYMKRITVLLVAIATLVGVVTFTAITFGHATAQEAAPIFVTKIPPGYRDWKVVSVAHEEGDLNDIRAVLGNDVAINAYRAGKLPFPEGAIVGRIAWSHVPSEENNKAFGRAQSFVAGGPTAYYLQFMVKDSKKYAATGGWGYSSFDKDGKPSPESDMKTCHPCHQAIKDRDFVFTRYTP
jgi:Cytochrome P460